MGDLQNLFQFVVYFIKQCWRAKELNYDEVRFVTFFPLGVISKNSV